MATIENACNNSLVNCVGNGYANATPVFKNLEVQVKSCTHDMPFDTSSSTVLRNCAVDSLPSQQTSSLVQKPVEIEASHTLLNSFHSPTNSLEKLNAVHFNPIMVQIANTDNNSNTENDDFLSTDKSARDIRLIENGAALNKLPSSSFDELIDTDENTTQIRLSPLPTEQEQSTESSNNSSVNSSSKATNQLFVETVLTASMHEEFNKQDVSFSMLQCTNQDSDKESLSSLSPQCNDTSDLNEISTPVAVLEESSLDSGIASLDDNEQVSKPFAETNSKKETKQFLKLGLTPTSILGRKRRYKELSTPQSIEKEDQPNTSRTKVKFDGVTVFYFPRKQSFVTVPSQGGSTLGMSLEHSHSKKMSLSQHKRTIARHHQKVIEEQKKQFRLDARLKQLKQTYPDMEMAQLISLATDHNHTDESQESSDEEDLDDVRNDESSSDDEYDDDNYYLQPIPAKKRRLLLRMAGVQKIDLDEKFSNKLTRESREVCGCDCENVCLPSSCQCALAGIPCQVDRESFPCGCLVSGCCNPCGRVEFDSERVKKHYFHTMRKLRLQETGAMPIDENQVLPQPPKSPYVSALERDAQALKDAREDSANSGSIVASYSESSALPVQSSFHQHIQINSNSSFSLNEAESWSGTYNNCGPGMSLAAGVPSDGIQNGAFDHFACGQEPYFDSSAFSDVTPGFLSTDLSSSNEIMAPTTAQSSVPLSDFDSSFSFPDEHFSLSSESKLSSVFAEGNQLGSRQTYKLDPITSFFPCATSSGRRMSQETSFLLNLPDSCSHLGDMMNHSSNPQPCSIESLLCSDEPVSRSRSSSLSEGSHDSIVKA